MPELVRACSSRAAKGKRGCIPHRNEFRFALSGINPNEFGFAPRAPLAPVAPLGEPLRCGKPLRCAGSPRCSKWRNRRGVPLASAVSRRATAGKCTPRCSKWRETPRRSCRSTCGRCFLPGTGRKVYRRNLRPGERQPHWTADPAGTRFQRGHFPAVERRETARSEKCPNEFGYAPLAPRKESGSAFRTHRELSV